MQRTRRTRLFGIEIDSMTLAEAADQVVGLARARRCDFVVTPNLDHVVLFQENSELRKAYAAASVVLADGWPLVAASRLLDVQALPERVAGSDLVPAVFARATAATPLSVFLLGAAPGVAERARDNIAERWPHARVAATYSPPLAFERDASENERIVERVNAVSPDVVVLGFGSPKQELWILAHRDRLSVGVAICAGATIDFLAGCKSRAPGWMGRAGLEWLHRLASEPRRLGPRYARDGIRFPPLLLREWRIRRAARATVLGD